MILLFFFLSFDCVCGTWYWFFSSINLTMVQFCTLSIVALWLSMLSRNLLIAYFYLFLILFTMMLLSFLTFNSLLRFPLFLVWFLLVFRCWLGGSWLIFRRFVTVVCFVHGWCLKPSYVYYILCFILTIPKIVWIGVLDVLFSYDPEP